MGQLAAHASLLGLIILSWNFIYKMILIVTSYARGSKMGFEL